MSGREYASCVLSHLEAGDGTPLVLIHAFPLSSTLFAPQLGALPARVIAPDLPGFGSSPGAIASLEDAARDVIALLDHLGVRRAVIGGVSMGGYVAMALLALAPERVGGLLLMDTHAKADTPTAREKRLQLADRVLAQGADALLPGMLDRLLPPGSRHRPQVEVWIRGADPKAVAAALRAMAARPDRTALLAAYDGPALVLAGELDPLAGPTVAAELARTLRCDELVVPGAGHLACFEEPTAANPAFARFLAEAEWE
jgi:pimeloyl-ACP methyl ester carboxylesterase